MINLEVMKFITSPFVLNRIALLPLLSLYLIETLQCYSYYILFSVFIITFDPDEFDCISVSKTRLTNLQFLPLVYKTHYMRCGSICYQ